MRHHNVNRKFGRERNQRKALLLSLAHALIMRGKIKTTEAKAKEVRPYVEKLVTRAKLTDLSSVRLLASRLGNNKAALDKIRKTIAPQYEARSGGYTRIVKMNPRKSDGAKMALIEFV